MMTYNDMKLFRIKHVMCSKPLESAVLAYVFLPSPLPASYALGSLVGFH